MAVVFGCQGCRELAWKRLRKAMCSSQRCLGKGLERTAQGGVALKCCKRCKGPAWRVALERLAEGLEGLEGGQMAALNPLKTDGRGGWLPRGARGLLGGLPWKGLRREGFEGFEAGQTAALNALKNRWPWCLVSGLPRVGLETLAQGDV